MKKQLLKIGNCQICTEEAILNKFEVCEPCMNNISKDYANLAKRGIKTKIEEVIEQKIILSMLSR